MVRYPIGRLSDLRWPFVGGFVAFLVVGLVVGQEPASAAASAAGYTLMAVSGIALYAAVAAFLARRRSR